MPHPLESKLAAAWPPSDWDDVTVMVAVSGGSDSVALLRALAALKGNGPGRLAVAHLNHQLRPTAADDERFVVELCRQLAVVCEVGHAAVDRLAARDGDGLEAAARAARYRFLEKTAGRLGARFVATAHTADDQAETILHRILRGTGIRGLAGMPRARPLGHATLMRPLLGVRRRELRDYLDALKQPWCQDQSNADLRFTRNRLRHQTMPQLRRQFNAGLTEALLRLGTLAGEAQAVADGLVAERLDRCVTTDESKAAYIELTELADCPPYLVRELLIVVWRRQGWPMQAMGQQQWEELAALAKPAAPPAQRVFPGGIMVEVAEGRMRLSRGSTLPSPRAPTEGWSRERGRG
jgi:tRNA(Ile)-lysidine synthase